MPNLPARQLREHPDLEQLKRQAKELLQAFLAGDAEARAEVAANSAAPIVTPWPCMTHNSSWQEAMASIAGPS